MPALDVSRYDCTREIRMRRRANRFGSLLLLAFVICSLALLVLPAQDRPAVYNRHLEAWRWLSLAFFIFVGWATNRGDRQ